MGLACPILRGSAPLLVWAWMRRGMAVLVHARVRWHVGPMGGTATVGAVTLRRAWR